MTQNKSGTVLAMGNRAAKTASAEKYKSSSIELLLSRLECVRKSGRGWVARCPAHEDRSPSLSICDGDDGRVLLLHCFAGCSAADIVAAIGLELADLFDRPREQLTPQRRAEVRDRVQRKTIGAALAQIEREVCICLMASADLARGNSLTREDHERVILAMERISDAKREIANARR